jgi:hypothetical protein
MFCTKTNGACANRARRYSGRRLVCSSETHSDAQLAHARTIEADEACDGPIRMLPHGAREHTTTIPMFPNKSEPCEEASPPVMVWCMVSWRGHPRRVDPDAAGRVEQMAKRADHPIEAASLCPKREYSLRMALAAWRSRPFWAGGSPVWALCPTKSIGIERLHGWRCITPQQRVGKLPMIR